MTWFDRLLAWLDRWPVLGLLVGVLSIVGVCVEAALDRLGLS